jgi:hypothetical protein
MEQNLTLDHSGVLISSECELESLESGWLACPLVKQDVCEEKRMDGLVLIGSQL